MNKEQARAIAELKEAYKEVMILIWKASFRIGGEIIEAANNAESEAREEARKEMKVSQKSINGLHRNCVY